MNKTIIDPSTLSEGQREAIRTLYQGCFSRNERIRGREKANPIKNKEVAFRTTFACGMNKGAMAAMTKLFGKEFFTNQKRE